MIENPAALFNLEGMNAVVTGGGSGIGAAIAETFAQAGAKVIVVDRDPAGGNAIAKKLGGQFLQLDVSSVSPG